VCFVIGTCRNFNYGACGAALGKDLLANPDQVAEDSATAFQTAVWFWMTQGPHDQILQGSFSGTIRAINGGIECNQPAGSVGNNQMLDRVQIYTSFCQTLAVDPGTDLDC
jgi:chitinase